MKKILLASVALFLAAPAFAADLTQEPAVEAGVVVKPAFSWTGFYVGGNGGYGWGSGDLDVSAIQALIPISIGTPDPDGWFGGAQIGYNYEFSNHIVLGVEADAEFGDLNATAGGLDGDPDAQDAISATAKVDRFGTIRGRVGYSFDRFLPYFTGGASWAHSKLSATYLGDDDVPVIESGDATNWGWTVGAGLEYAVTDHWTVKGEYLYQDFGKNDYTVLNLPVSFGTAISSVKAGFNYKF